MAGKKLVEAESNRVRVSGDACGFSGKITFLADVACGLHVNLKSEVNGVHKLLHRSL